MTITRETIEKLVAEAQSYQHRQARDFFLAHEERSYGERLIARLIGALCSEHKRADEAAAKVMDLSEYVSYLEKLHWTLSARVRQLENPKNGETAND